jgi:hypothetical protein
MDETKIAKVQSDYDPDTILTLIRNNDGDIIIHIYGNGEMRFATSGSHLCGKNKREIFPLFSKIIDIFNEEKFKPE